MKLLLILSLMIGTAFAANKRTAQITQPEDQEQMRMEGVDVPAEEINTAPSPVPTNGDSDMTPTITDEKPVKQKQEEPEIMDEEEEP